MELLQLLAAEGGGRFHVTQSSDEIPVVTVAEAESAGSQSDHPRRLPSDSDRAEPDLERLLARRATAARWL